MTTLNLAQAFTRISDLADSAKHTVDAFGERYAKDPAYALSWATETFEAAAIYEVASFYVKFLTGEVNSAYEGDRVATMISECESRLRDASQRRASSTSACSNLMEDCRRVAYAKVLNLLNGQMY